jgi:hypothetical protein
MTIAMRHVVKFPARVQATKGVDVTRANGTYTFKLNYENLTPAASVASNANVAFQDPATGEMGVTSLSSALNSNANIQAIANATTAADKIGYWNGTASYVMTDFTAFGRTLVGTADAEAARTSLGVTASADLATVATSGDYADLSGLPTLGDMAAKDKVAVADIDATGTPSATTAYFGDGVWRTPAGVGDVVAANDLSDLANVATARKNLGIYETIADLQAANVPAVITKVLLLGYYAAGDGGEHIRINDASGDITSADGAKWLVKSSRPNVRMYGAKGIGSSFDDAPAFRAAIAANAGKKIELTSGHFYWNSLDNGHILNIAESSLWLEGDGWNIKQGSYSNSIGSIIEMGNSIADTADAIRFSGTDAYYGSILRDFAILAYGGVYGSPRGRHGIHVDAGTDVNFLQNNMLIENLFIDNMKTGYSIKGTTPSNSVTGGLAYARVRDCRVMNMKFDYTGDQNLIGWNTVGFNCTDDTRNVGIKWNNITGAANFQCIGNVIGSFYSQIICDGGVKPVIRDNELELGDVVSGGGVLIDMNGAASVVLHPTITGNTLSQNSTHGLYTPVRLNNAMSPSVYDNRLAVHATSAHIAVTSSCFNALIGTNQYTTAGSEDIFGNISIADPWTRSDGPWLSWTPTVAMSSPGGTPITATGSGKYRLTTNTMFFELTITVSNVGSGNTGQLTFTTPITFAGAVPGGGGKETAIVGKAVALQVLGAGVIGIIYVDGSDILAAGNGSTFAIQGSIRRA